MVEGQMQDLAAEGRTLELDDLQSLHRLKTGALIEAALYAGAVLAGGNQKQIDQLQAYGRHIGLAFQIVDDVLNVTGDPNVTGKAIGTDATRRKSTYPALLGLEQSRRYARDAIEKALLALIDFDNKADPLRALAEFIIDREH
jgi:geranylgeranyl diphosphate synthase type II